MKRWIAKILCIIMVLTGVIMPNFSSKAQAAYSLTGTAHIQGIGDKAGTWNGESLVLGTKGQSRRLESITINFVNNTGYEGNLEYRVHIQKNGWSKDWVKSGTPAGTRGERKRLEGIQIRLTGELAKHYSVMYRVHIQTYGDKQDWVCDGAVAGTERESKRLENLEVKLVPKNVRNGVAYRVHRQTYSWEGLTSNEPFYRMDGNVSGVTKQSKRLEGIEIILTGNEYDGEIHYKTQVQTKGWLSEVQDGVMSGTTGESKRLETIKIWLTGEVSNHYDIYYRVHSQTYGWMSWAKNGEPAGTEGLAKRLEAIQIKLVLKGNPAPGKTFKGVTATSDYSYCNRNENVYGHNGNTNDGQKDTSGSGGTTPPTSSDNNNDNTQANTFTRIDTPESWNHKCKNFKYCRNCYGMWSDEDGAVATGHGKNCVDAVWNDYYLTTDGVSTHYYQCSVCKFVFVKEGDFNSHKGYAHPTNFGASQDISIDSEYIPPKTEWGCDNCKKLFSTEKDRDAHKNVDCSKNVISYTCPTCGKHFDNLSDFFADRRIHDGQ